MQREESRMRAESYRHRHWIGGKRDPRDVELEKGAEKTETLPSRFGRHT